MCPLKAGTTVLCHHKKNFEMSPILPGFESNVSKANISCVHIMLNYC